MNIPIETVSQKRLIVLVPEGLAGNANLAKRVYWMALRDHCDVLYVAIVENEETKLTASRGLATMKALTTGQQVAVATKITNANHWIQTLHSLYQPGDIMVCHEGQFVRDGFMKASPIQALLADEFKAPIVTISGIYHPWQMLTRKWLLGLVFWLGCLVILGAFGLLEFQVDRSVQGAAGTVLIFVVLAGEFAAFWAWNHIPKS